jgi:hypothetical protein
MQGFKGFVEDDDVRRHRPAAPVEDAGCGRIYNVSSVNISFRLVAKRARGRRVLWRLKYMLL